MIVARGNLIPNHARREGFEGSTKKPLLPPSIFESKKEFPNLTCVPHMITYHTNLILNIYYFVCWLVTGKRYSSRDKISNKIPVALILDFVLMTKPKGQSRVAVGARQFQNNKKANKQMNPQDNCSVAMQVLKDMSQKVYHLFRVHSL